MHSSICSIDEMNISILMLNVSVLHEKQQHSSRKVVLL
ncbi:hypothetical protein VCJ_001438 [Vibrio metoecus]|nr:hypothetical protein VCJ_001438 [Vibrio metoecus]